MGERQHADLLDAMKVTVEEQIAVHIGYVSTNACLTMHDLIIRSSISGS